MQTIEGAVKKVKIGNEISFGISRKEFLGC